MVCLRCKVAVEKIFSDAGLHPVSVILGEVIVEEREPDPEQILQLKQELEKAGFELMDDKKSKMIEQIKTIIIEQIHYSNELPQYNFSTIISQQVQHDYSYLSKLFSEVEGITIEQYILQQKIEKVKELLHYNELPLSRIAIDMGYSSTAHLSAQFKKITGLTPTEFKRSGIHHRHTLDSIGKTK